MPTVAFLGGDAFAVPALRAIAAHGQLELALAACPPERPSGRGMKKRASPIAVACGELGMDCLRLSADDNIADAVRKVRADFCVVCTYGVKLGPLALAAPVYSCINIHASLLPRWRGAAPVERAILAGDGQTGVTTIKMSERIDAGEILLSERTTIGEYEAAGELRDRLAKIGAGLVVKTMLNYGSITPQAQDRSQVTRAPKISKEEAAIDWQEDALAVCAKVRAFNPRPGAYCEALGQRLKVLGARLASGAGKPGTVLEKSAAGLVVACGSNAVLVQEVVPAGGRKMDAGSWLRGLRASCKPGDHLSANQ